MAFLFRLRVQWATIATHAKSQRKIQSLSSLQLGNLNVVRSFPKGRTGTWESFCFFPFHSLSLYSSHWFLKHLPAIHPFFLHRPWTHGLFALNRLSSWVFLLGVTSAFLGHFEPIGDLLKLLPFVSPVESFFVSPGDHSLSSTKYSFVIYLLAGNILSVLEFTLSSLVVEKTWSNTDLIISLLVNFFAKRKPHLCGFMLGSGLANSFGPQ